MPQPLARDVISHWYHLFDGFQHSPQEFYSLVSAAIAWREVPDATMVKTEIKEGGVLSAKRLYLEVRRKQLVFDICGAPFGKGFFVSWWLREPMAGCLPLLLDLPWIGTVFWFFVRPFTFYKMDTALMFQESVHRAVMEVLDQITTAKGIRGLTDDERKPIMKEFFSR